MLQQLLQRSNCLLNRRNRYQLLTTLVLNLIAISHGIGTGWISPTLRVMQTEETPSFKLSISEVSWIGSLLGLGGIAGNLFASLLMNRIGRKACLLLLTLPYMAMWLCVRFATRVEYFYVARLLGGLCSGIMYVVQPIFIAEIADANIRGTLSAMLMLSVNFGVLLGYIIGTHVAFGIAPWLMLVLPTIFLLSHIFYFPETPQHLISKGKYEAAERSFRYYKNIKSTDSPSEQVSALSEFEDMKLLLSKNKLRQESDSLTYKDFVTPAALRAYGPAATLLIANQFSGMFSFINYMSDIFAKSGSTMDPNTCTIIIGAVQIFGTYVATLLCDIYGRKILMLVSTAGVAICLTAFGFFTDYAPKSSEYSWLPLLLMSLNIFLGNIGLVGCFYVLLVEVFPAKIRAQAASVALIICSFLIFVTLNIFPLCLHHWGISTTMWCCASVTAASFFFFLYLLEETKGKSMLDD